MHFCRGLTPDRCPAGNHAEAMRHANAALELLRSELSIQGGRNAHKVRAEKKLNSRYGARGRGAATRATVRLARAASAHRAASRGLGRACTASMPRAARLLCLSSTLPARHRRAGTTRSRAGC